MHAKAVDDWSSIHWIFGFMIASLFFKLNIELIYVALALIFWEIVEYLWLGKAIFGRLGLNGEESVINIISDLFFGSIGAIFAYYIFFT